MDKPAHVLTSDQDWASGILLHGYKHPSTWPGDNLFPTIIENVYMGKGLSAYYDNLHQHVTMLSLAHFMVMGLL